MSLRAIRTVLLLAGTTEARDLAAEIAADRALARRLHVITSFSGVSEAAAEAPGPLRANARRGRFAGADGLVTALKWDRVDLIIDATHPFSARISAYAVAACRALGLPLLQIVRPSWTPSDGDDWREAPSVADAAETLPFFCRAFLATGRASLPAFRERRDVWFLARVLDPPGARFPLPRGDYAVGRPPYTLAHERMLLTDYRITWLVCLNAGGVIGQPTLAAARELGLPVIMVPRPPLPDPPAGGVRVTSSMEAAAWLRVRLGA